MTGKKKEEKKKEEKITKEAITKEELIALLTKKNYIEVEGVCVSSDNASLKEVEQTINRLIEKHKNFLEMKRELKMKSRGYIE